MLIIRKRKNPKPDYEFADDIRDLVAIGWKKWCIDTRTSTCLVEAEPQQIMAATIRLLNKYGVEIINTKKLSKMIRKRRKY